MAAMDSKYSDERSLVEACLEGCDHAWQVFQQKYTQLIYSILSWPQWKFSRQDMEDICEDIIIKMIDSGLRRFDYRSSLATYLGAITKRACLDRVRGRRENRCRVLSLEQDTVMGRPFAQMLESGMNVSEIVMKRETVREISEAFTKLKEDCQTILRLRYREEMAYDQIAQFMKLPIGTVCSHVSRCMDQLIRLISPALYLAQAGRGERRRK